MRILERFYAAMAQDLMIGFFFEGRDLHEISRKQAMFVLLAAGKTNIFEGKGPASAHAALPPILQGHFDRRLLILREVLAEESLSSGQIDLWVRFEESFRAVVVSD